MQQYVYIRRSLSYMAGKQSGDGPAELSTIPRITGTQASKDEGGRAGLGGIYN